MSSTTAVRYGELRSLPAQYSVGVGLTPHQHLVVAIMCSWILIYRCEYATLGLSTVQGMSTSAKEPIGLCTTTDLGAGHITVPTTTG
jgi:hypothetical protein